MTPHGFLKAAAANKATARQRGWTAHAVVPGARQSTPSPARSTMQNLVERVETRVDNTMLGDMLVEAVYSGLQGLRRRQVSDADRRTAGRPSDAGHHGQRVCSRMARRRSRSCETRRPAPADTAATSERLGDGVWMITAGLNSVLVEFTDHLVVVEALGNDARSHAVMAEVKRLVPNKPIRYLVNTHAHFDHSGGVRAFAAEGVTIVTQEVNKPFFEKVLTLPHQINPDSLAKSNRRPSSKGSATSAS